MYHLKYLTIMSLNYSIAMMGNPLKKEEPKKAYAKAQTNGELSLKELSTLIASKCTVHQADVSASAHRHHRVHAGRSESR